MTLYTIKPLAWREATTANGVYYAETDTPFGTLSISPRASGLDYYWDREDTQEGGIAPDYDAAKAAAEAWYRAKMGEGLEPQADRQSTPVTPEGLRGLGLIDEEGLYFHHDDGRWDIGVWYHEKPGEPCSVGLSCAATDIETVGRLIEVLRRMNGGGT